MPWFCSSCNTSQEIVFTTKFADIFSIGMGDLCLRCIQTIAEQNIGMEKYDALGIGYTNDVLKEGALQLMECSHCHRYRSSILLSKPSDMCCSCFTYYMYQNTKGEIE